MADSHLNRHQDIINLKTILSFDTFQAGWKLLEIFSSVETPAGRACSRDVKLFHLDFDKSGVLVSIEVQCALLDKNHVTSTMHDFSNYLALHMLAEGAQTELKKDLFMNEKTKTDNRLGSPNLISVPNHLGFKLYVDPWHKVSSTKEFQS